MAQTGNYFADDRLPITADMQADEIVKELNRAEEQWRRQAISPDAETSAKAREMLGLIASARAELGDEQKIAAYKARVQQGVDGVIQQVVSETLKRNVLAVAPQAVAAGSIDGVSAQLSESFQMLVNALVGLQNDGAGCMLPRQERALDALAPVLDVLFNCPVTERDLMTALDALIKVNEACLIGRNSAANLPDDPHLLFLLSSLCALAVNAYRSSGSSAYLTGQTGQGSGEVAARLRLSSQAMSRCNVPTYRAQGNLQLAQERVATGDVDKALEFARKAVREAQQGSSLAAQAQELVRQLEAACKERRAQAEAAERERRAAEEARRAAEEAKRAEEARRAEEAKAAEKKGEVQGTLLIAGIVVLAALYFLARDLFWQVVFVLLVVLVLKWKLSK